MKFAGHIAADGGAQTLSIQNQIRRLKSSFELES